MMLVKPADNFAIFGSMGMAGSAISRALERAGYNQQLKPTRQELDLLDPVSVHQWFSENQPKVVVLAAAKVVAFMRMPPTRRILLRTSRYRRM